MITRSLFSMLFFFVFALPTLAQGRFEVQPFVGYKFGGGIPVGSNDLNINRINFNSSASAGVSAAFNATESAALEFLWNRQSTTALHCAARRLLHHHVDQLHLSVSL